MSPRSGVVNITGNVARLDDDTLLARCDANDPVSGGTAYLRGLGFQTGDRIRVTGNDDQIGGVTVFCMTSAQRASAGAEALASNKARRNRKASRRKKQTAKKDPSKKAKTTSTKKNSRGRK